VGVGTAPLHIPARMFLVRLTEFGDAAVLVPLAATIFVWLVLSRVPRAAGWWAVSVLLCGGVTAVLKVLFWGCPPYPDLHSPSGHTSLATLVYGATALITAIEGAGRRPQIASAAGAGLILAIGASRLLLHTHSLPEVILGWIIGGACLAFFARFYRRWRPEHAHVTPLLVGVVVVASALHGSALRAEELLHRITDYFRIDCY
jgi:membrane-associated phospholipid phosphatase